MPKSHLKRAPARLPFRIHPRVFAALGADLVTNDVVAVIELVKNSYDAYANNVWIRFRSLANGSGDYLEIEDDGLGMTRAVIEEAWATVASPFKEEHPTATRRGAKPRRVAGEKGLGRLSAARLGDRLELITRPPSGQCWEVKVNWRSLAKAKKLAGCFATIRPVSPPQDFPESGTRIRINNLKATWDEDRILDLQENLARLISPFETKISFRIFLARPGDEGSESVRIEPPAFLSQPKYSIAGEVTEKGDITAVYSFRPIAEGAPREASIKMTWGQVLDSVTDRRDKQLLNSKSARCGPFDFEIRAWDIAPEDTDQIAQRFDFQKSRVRRAIRSHKGISVYRDGVLVLPKSEAARDWLGLDLRRVSKVGTRLSTSQIVGYVAITARDNATIEDTSDRERLVSNVEVTEFEELLKTIVAQLENERDLDRLAQRAEPPIQDLFAELSVAATVEDVKALAEEGAPASEALPIVVAYGERLDKAVRTLQERLVFYSRLATVGTISQMLVHEIRNRTTAIGLFLSILKKELPEVGAKTRLAVEYQSAEGAVAALERLADTFSPLASRTFRRGRRSSVLEERIRESVGLVAKELDSKGVRVDVPDSTTEVAVDPGELEAILVNLVSNSAYWLSQAPATARRIQFDIEPGDLKSRVRVWVHDSGPGIPIEDAERVFWPGVTRKPGGIGMGLTVASELVAEYGGRMSLAFPGHLGGASFSFDLPKVAEN